MFPNTDATPIDLTPYCGLQAAVDIIANPLETRFLREARERGARTAGGLDMLVAQAGVMIWELTQDTPDKSRSLLQAIGKTAE